MDLKTCFTVDVLRADGWACLSRSNMSIWPSSSWRPIFYLSLHILKGLDDASLMMFSWSSYLRIEYSWTRRSTLALRSILTALPLERITSHALELPIT